MKKILLIDDSIFEWDILNHLTSPYKVDMRHAESVSQAMNILNTFIPDLIILDLNLGCEDGFEFLKERVKSPWIQAIPVLVSSGRGDLAAITRALASGATGYLIKDLDARTLIKEVKKIGIGLNVKKGEEK